MIKILLEVTEELNKRLRLYQIENNHKNKQQAINMILKKELGVK